jgi:sterol desaturase/sphingolipid hydroxylase (fatty acid hydroxylase superfamily)
MLPTVVGVVTVVLCLLDILSRLDIRVGAFLRLTLGADFRNREMSHDPPLRREVAQVAWMLGCVVLILFIGILPAVPLFVLGYMRLVGRTPWLGSVLSAGLVLCFVIVVFELLLDTTLYRGVLFDPKGFGAW